MRCMAIGTHTRIRISDTLVAVNHRRHTLQINLVHDAVTRRDHIDVFKRMLGPVDEMKTVFITTIFNRTIFLERLRIVTTALHRERVINDQLHRHDRIHLGRVTTLIRNRITQTCQIHQRSLTENVMTHHACRKPRKVEITLTLDQLLERRRQCRWIAATHQIFGEHARGVRQFVPGTRLDCINGFTCVEIVEAGTR